MFMKQSNKISFIITSFVILSSSLIWYFDHYNNNFFNHSSITKDDSEKNLNPIYTNLKEINITNDSPQIPLNTQQREAEIAASKNILEWRMSHGYFSKSELLVYESYSDKVLSNLLNNGDLRAAEVLGKHILASQNNPNALKNFSAVMFKAAAYGSTWALIQASDSVIPGEHLDDPAYQRKQLLVSLSLYRVAGIRGDTQGADRFSTADIRYYEHRFGKLNLTDKEREKIENSAQNFYKKLEEYRIKLGAGPFNNEPPMNNIK